jgi:hypothetical protein
LSALDALHVTAAMMLAADELVTSEGLRQPIFRVTELRVVSIRAWRKRQDHEPDRIVPVRHECQSDTRLRAYLLTDRLTNQGVSRSSCESRFSAPVGTIFAMSCGEWLPAVLHHPRWRQTESENPF